MEDLMKLIKALVEFTDNTNAAHLTFATIYPNYKMYNTQYLRAELQNNAQANGFRYCLSESEEAIEIYSLKTPTTIGILNIRLSGLEENL